jgi:uncharacterized phage protein (TIGR02218 family)
MGFVEVEGSTRRAGPIRLFRFQVDQNRFFRYTDNDRDVQFDDETFTAIPIDSPDTSSTTLLENDTYEITMPKVADMAEYLKAYPPSFVMRAEVFMLHPERAPEDRRRVFIGKIVGVSTRGAEAIVSCDTLDSSFRNPGLRRTYQRQCPHVLYGPACRAAKVPLDLVVLPLTAGINTLALEDFPVSEDAAHYLGGQIEWSIPDGKVVRNIIQSYRDGTSLRLALAGPANTALPGSTVSIFKGCERTEESCTERFDNILNYGGQPWIPLENPIQSISTYL